MEFVDLTFLRRFTKGDEVKMKRYVSMYLKYSTELLEKMQDALTDRDSKNLAIHAHSLKPQAEMIGVIGLKEKLLLIEDKSRVNDLLEIPLLLDQVVDINRKAESELSAMYS